MDERTKTQNLREDVEVQSKAWKRAYLRLANTAKTIDVIVSRAIVNWCDNITHNIQQRTKKTKRRN